MNRKTFWLGVDVAGSNAFSRGAGKLNRAVARRNGVKNAKKSALEKPSSRAPTRKYLETIYQVGGDPLQSRTARVKGGTRLNKKSGGKRP